MILESLVSYYEAMAAKGEIARPGWAPAKVSFALSLTPEGELEQVLHMQTEQARGKKTVLAPQILSLPAPVKRTVGISANFLCDNSSYLLGIDEKGKPERALECFNDCKKLHQKLLANVDCIPAKAVFSFFENWDPTAARSHPVLAECLEEILSGGNLIFQVDGQNVHEDASIQKAWDQHFGGATEDAQEAICMVTGEYGSVALTHPAIKGLVGAQSSGAALVSFNAPAFCSYGKEQNLNAPTSKYAAFAYTAALNHLLADREHTYHIGDTTVLFWAKSAESGYPDYFSGMLDADTYTSADLEGTLSNLLQGNPVLFEETMLDPEMEFYILGLSPNAARISIRFFLRNSFGAFLQNIEAHNKRLEIIRPSFDHFPNIPLWKLLDETVNQNSRDKAPKPGLAGECLRAILENTRYPATLLNGVTLRIRAEQEITRGRAAILKAYYTKNPHPDIDPKEVLTVSLNPESKSVPYQLGRLFSVLEDIQERANPGINTTIKDRYFNSASATPSLVFPTLINLAQKHLKKLDSGRTVYYNKQLTAILAQVGEGFPTRLSLPEQGAFQLGYYHQTQARYQTKEEK